MRGVAQGQRKSVPRLELSCGCTGCTRNVLGSAVKRGEDAHRLGLVTGDRREVFTSAARYEGFARVVTLPVLTLKKARGSSPYSDASKDTMTVRCCASIGQFAPARMLITRLSSGLHVFKAKHGFQGRTAAGQGWAGLGRLWAGGAAVAPAGLMADMSAFFRSLQRLGQPQRPSPAETVGVWGQSPVGGFRRPNLSAQPEAGKPVPSCQARRAQNDS